jgi:hypothetical protein
MKIYHGSYTEIQRPKILKNRFSKDFGAGFYCTEIEEQAVRWASRYEVAVVSIYEYIPDKSLKILVFKEMNEETPNTSNLFLLKKSVRNDTIY